MAGTRCSAACFCASLIIAALIGVTAAHADELPPLAFSPRFVAGDHIVDDAQGGASHSEGQGIAMLLAVARGDRTDFDRLWAWTKAHLQVRNDALFAWRWLPNQSIAVPDRNDAADGDLLIAWALARAGDRFGAVSYRAEAKRIAVDIRTKLMRHVGGLTLLLPGADGFERDGALLLNPSYWVYPALAALDAVDPSPDWTSVAAGGHALLEKATFGRWKLPPDWVLLAGDGSVSMPADKPKRFGFEAIRVPLYLLWAGYPDAHRLTPFVEFWESFRNFPFTPAWTDLDDDAIASYGVDEGFRAIADLTLRASGRQPLADDRQQSSAQPSYYHEALRLLADLARRERPTP